MRAVLRWIGVVAAAVLLGGGSAAMAAAGSARPEFRTEAQAARFLERGLRRWDGVDLRRAEYRSAFCVGRRADDSSRTRFRSFECTLDVTARSEKSYVFAVRLVPTRSGWRVSVLR